MVRYSESDLWEETFKRPSEVIYKIRKDTKTWIQFKEALEAEFSESADSHQIHKKLSQTHKTLNEFYQEYIYKMFEIADPASIGTSAVIKYIIDGIQDAEVNKQILYGTSLKELKMKFALYETMKEKIKSQTNRKNDDRTKKTALLIF